MPRLTFKEIKDLYYPRKYTVLVDIYDAYDPEKEAERARKTGFRRKPNPRDRMTVNENEYRLLYRGESYKIEANGLFQPKYIERTLIHGSEDWKDFIAKIMQDGNFQTRFEFQLEASFTFRAKSVPNWRPFSNSARLGAPKNSRLPVSSHLYSVAIFSNWR